MVLPFLIAEARDEIDKATTDEPRNLRVQYWSIHSGTWSGEDAWKVLDTYLHHIESKLADIVRLHSHFFWLHLYRRIGVALHPSLSNKQDASTIGLVRNIMEAAFVKHAPSALSLPDIELSSRVAPGQVFGGHLMRIMRKKMAPAMVDAYFASLSDANLWVITALSDADVPHIFRMEALAYEYWLTTARMRRVGKGGAISVTGGEVTGLGSPELEKLLVNYDQRTESLDFDVSSIGVGFYGEPQRGDLVSLLPVYNVSKIRLADISFDETLKATDIVPNFVFYPMRTGAFALAHSFAHVAFFEAKGFSLNGLCGYLTAISGLEFGQIEKASNVQRTVGLLHLFQRAYTVTPEAGYSQVLLDTAIKYMDAWLGEGRHDIRGEAERIEEYLTLTDAKRSVTSLWTTGPRYAFIKHNDAIIVDLQGLGAILHTALFRVRHDQREKGYAFEDEFREYAQKSGLTLLPERTLRVSQNVFREADALIKVGDRLFICECRAMERPLDFEIGRIQTIVRRNDELDKKIGQVDSLAQFIRAHPTGTNYDLSWASDIVCLVVSPYEEWIWSESEKYWFDSETPRILSATAAVDFMLRPSTST